MKKTTKEITTTQYVKETIEVIVCSDGREFSLSNKQAAERWEIQVTKRNEYKKQINYKSVELELCNHYHSSHSHSFVFDWDGIEENNRLCDLTNIMPNGFTFHGPVGRYLVIEYINEVGEYTSFEGYFGLLSDYIAMLEKETEKAKTLLIP